LALVLASVLALVLIFVLVSVSVLGLVLEVKFLSFMCESFTFQPDFSF
jgi:hypothetical protein